MTPEELLRRAGECGFRVELSGSGSPQLVPVRSGASLPPELLAALRASRGAVAELLAACPLCGRPVAGEERQRVKDPAFCDRGGAPAARLRDGTLVREEVARCPFK